MGFTQCLSLIILFQYFIVYDIIYFLAFLKRVTGGPHPEMYEDW